MQQLIKKGHREIDEIDQGLGRAERIVNDTVDIGTQVGRAWGGRVSLGPQLGLRGGDTRSRR